MSAVDDIAAYLAYLKTGGNRIDQIIFDELPNGEEMNATDELRRLLDERGVEYTVVPEDMYSREYIKIGNIEILTNDRGEVAVYYLTPEQAVEATLGRGTCRMTEQDDRFGWWECSECGGILPAPDIINYCPNCGRKVVDA